MKRIARDPYAQREFAIEWRDGVVDGGAAVTTVKGRGQTVGEWLRGELAAAWAACGTFECVALGYLGVSGTLIIFFAENLAHPVRLIGMQVSVAVLILLLCRTARVAARQESGGREEGAETEATGKSVCPTFTRIFWHFWRHWYPHLYFLFCFEELGRLVHLVQPEWQDAKLIAFDHWLTGVHPTVWLEQFATPARNDFMQCVYLTYFTYLLVVGGILYYRRDWLGYWSVMTYSAIAYAIGYVIAIFFRSKAHGFRWPAHGTDHCRAVRQPRQSISSSTMGACAARRFPRNMWPERLRRHGALGGTADGCLG